MPLSLDPSPELSINTERPPIKWASTLLATFLQKTLAIANFTGTQYATDCRY